MASYISSTYEQSVTRLRCADWESDAIRPSCGVKQGDPLSPMIFNLVIDRLLSALPKEIGVTIGSVPVNAMAFADDIVLFAETAEGLQALLDISAGFLQKCGLCVNSSKSLTAALKNVPKEKKCVVDKKQKFTCNGHPMPALSRSEEWKYLGVPFTPEGRLLSCPVDKLKSDLNILTKAPLKPQQRLFALRTAVIPALYHCLVLGKTNISMLNKLDMTTRLSVRKWLDLPHDVPSAYFHADVKDGGLSIPSYRWTVPLQRFHRLRSLKALQGEETPVKMKDFIELELKRAQQRIDDHNTVINTTALCKLRFAKLLHKSNDGGPLLSSRGVENQHQWVTDGNLFVSGRDFIRMNKLRINAVPLKTRLARGQARDRYCRAGCNDGETLHHVLQLCPRTHSSRIRRHDACLAYLEKCLDKTDAVFREPKFRTPQGEAKPDIIIKRDNTAFVVDALIAGERTELDRAHQDKTNKYLHLESDIKQKYSVGNVRFTSLTISSRGVWSKRSFDSLIRLGLLKKGDGKVLSTRALIGGLTILGQFYKSTAVGKHRRIEPLGC